MSLRIAHVQLGQLACWGTKGGARGGLLLVLLAFLDPLGPSANASDLKSAVSTGPVPDWVTPLEWTVPADSPAGVAAQIILADAQDKLVPNGGDYFYHAVTRLLTAEAVTRYSQPQNELSPEFEDVTWHTLKVYRGDQAQDRLGSAEFRKLQREPGLEAQLLTGQTTYAAVLNDIQVGDVVETAYTLHYNNPLYAGHMSDRQYLGDSSPIVRERVIIHVPRDGREIRRFFLLPDQTQGLPDKLFRPSEIQGLLEERETPSEKIFQWEARDLPAVEFDAGMPASAYPYWPMLRVTSFVTWSDVVDWALPLFRSDKLPPSVLKLLDKWKAEPDAEKRLEAAVTWVQNDVRYFALDLGQHTLKPRPLEDVCSSGFGDCKDKAVLLTAILRALGYEAWPALTNTYWRDRLHSVRPHPHDFNHAIVAYRHHDRLCWIDPTIPQQHRAGGEWAIPPYRTALILRARENDLTDLAVPGEPTPDTETLDHITIDPKSGDGLMTTTVTITGIYADYLRPTLTTVSPAERAKQWFNFISLFYRGVDEVKGPAWKDIPGDDKIVVSAEYRLPGFVHHEAGQPVIVVYGYALRSLLDVPTSRRRHWAYGLPRDRFIRHRIEVELPFDAPPDQLPEIIRGPGLEYRIERGVSNRRLVVQHDLRFPADAVDPAQMDQFADNVRELLDAAATVVRNVPAKTEQVPNAPAQVQAPPASATSQDKVSSTETR